MSLDFFVPGEPRGEPRTRARGMMIGGKARARVYRDTSADVWKQTVAINAITADGFPAKPFDCPIDVHLTFVMPRPKSRKNDVWHTAKPDADNLAKAVLDVLTKVGLWVDDSRVAGLTVLKVYSTIDSLSGCKVLVEELR